MVNIAEIKAREVLDSLGDPTIEVEVILKCGIVGRATAPSNYSRLNILSNDTRDGDTSRFRGLGVRWALHNMHETIFPEISNRNVLDQISIDAILAKSLKTDKKNNVSSNLILSVSLAIASAAASFQEIPLYRWIRDIANRLKFQQSTPNGNKKITVPLPIVNMLTGNLPRYKNLDFKGFSIVPVGAKTLMAGIEMISAVWHGTRERLELNGDNIGISDLGGFAPHFNTNREAVRLLEDSIKSSGFKPGQDISIYVEVSASNFFEKGLYIMHHPRIDLNSKEMVELLKDWVTNHSVSYIEDGIADDDLRGWKLLNEYIGNQCQLVGDSFFSSNLGLLSHIANERLSNGILIHLSDAGTVTDGIKEVIRARENGCKIIIGGQGGDSGDRLIVDFAVAINADQIKLGSLHSQENIAKYNRLLFISDEIVDKR